MNKYEYLAELREKLGSLPKTEQDEAVRYYRGVFNDAGRQNEQLVIKHLGSPEHLANRILNSDESLSSVLSSTRKEVRKASGQLTPKQKKTIITVSIILLPVWILLIIAVAVAIVMLFLGAAGLFIGMTVVGIALVCMGIVHIIETASIGLVHIGIGLMMIGVSLLLFLPAMNLVFWIFKKIIKGFSVLITKLTGKAGVRA